MRHEGRQLIAVPLGQAVRASVTNLGSAALTIGLAAVFMPLVERAAAPANARPTDETSRLRHCLKVAIPFAVQSGCVVPAFALFT